MVIFGIVIVVLSLIGLGWFIGVTVERHMYVKVSTPSASHNKQSAPVEKPTLEPQMWGGNSPTYSDYKKVSG